MCAYLSRNVAMFRTVKGEYIFQLVDAKCYWISKLFYYMRSYSSNSHTNCDNDIWHRCLRCLQQVDYEYKMLKTKLQDLFNVSFKLCENLLVLLVYSFY